MVGGTKTPGGSVLFLIGNYFPYLSNWSLSVSCGFKRIC